jgi:hypothetical protein
MADEPNVEQPTTTPPVDNDEPADEADTQDSVNQEPLPGEQSGDEAVGGSGAQQRIRKLSADKRTLLEERNYWREVATRYATGDATKVAAQPVPAPNNPAAYPADEVERAYRTLKDRGMVTQDDLLRLEWDRQHDKNEARFNASSSNLPHYDRHEVEAHARSMGISDPTAAYHDLYFDEMLDASRRRAPRSQSMPATQKPSKPAEEARETLDLEGFRRKLNSPEGRKFYEDLLKDPRKFDEVMQALSATE